jgi:hypothetical protein
VDVRYAGIFFVGLGRPVRASVVGGFVFMAMGPDCGGLAAADLPVLWRANWIPSLLMVSEINQLHGAAPDAREARDPWLGRAGDVSAACRKFRSAKVERALRPLSRQRGQRTDSTRK